jgi:UDP-N-acetylmuramate--alanine ligase
MNGLALVCAQLGAEVSGSDRAEAPHLDRLRAAGVRVSIGQTPENVPHSSELVYSSAVRSDNVERERGRELGLPEIRRGELLGELTRLRRCLAVAGTHGKTTTSAMIVHALRSAGQPPAYVVGAPLRDGSPSASWEPGEWLIVETDESDRTFLAIEPEIAVVTNVAFEHMNNYATMGDLQAAFETFLSRSERIVIADRPDLRALCGARPLAAFDPGEIRLGRGGARFSWRGRSVRLCVPGEHNARNAAGALEACRLLGIDLDQAVASLSTYAGARRRLEPIGVSAEGARIYDDYANHGNEVRASLAALRTVEAGRVVVVFEPVLFTRMRAMAPDLGAALAGADVLIVLGLFEGSEAGQHHPGVSGRTIADAAAAQSDSVFYEPDEAAALARLESILGAGDACVFMGVSPAPQRIARELIAAAGRSSP